MTSTIDLKTQLTILADALTRIVDIVAIAPPDQSRASDELVRIGDLAAQARGATGETLEISAWANESSRAHVNEGSNAPEKSRIAPRS
jgi:hypothetical protein